jgi:antitoxin HicB
MFYKIPLVITPQSESGFMVTSPILPELVTEGDSIEEVLINVQDALQAIVEAYQDTGRELPFALKSLETEFLSAADYVLNKNNKLYNRLR